MHVSSVFCSFNFYYCSQRHYKYLFASVEIINLHESKIINNSVMWFTKFYYNSLTSAEKKKNQLG